MPSFNQYNYRPFTNVKIILSEECYIRLLGDANLCGLHMGIDNNEYGTMLYGNLKQTKTEEYAFYFEVPSEIDDYTPTSKKTNLGTPAMNNELIENALLENANYNCVAHVHTHPYLNEESRFLSDKDIEQYKLFFKNWSNLATSQGNVLNTLACLITVGNNNLAKEDDISFIHYDQNSEEFHIIPSISVIIKGKEIPLKKMNGSVTLEDGSTSYFERNNLVTDDHIPKDKGNNHQRRLKL